MLKPVMNLEEAVFDDLEDNGYYTSSRALFSPLIGARQLGYNLTVLPPGKAQCPFHNHHGEEEMFFILEGRGELRFGAQRWPLRPHDVVACPTGGPEVAHQIINTGSVPLRYLAVSTVLELEACEYPDSQKLLVAAGPRGQRRLAKLFRAEAHVDYYDREETNAMPTAKTTAAKTTATKSTPAKSAASKPPSAAADKPKGPASYFPSIEKTYGQPIAHWMQIIQNAGPLKHMELVALLKSEHGLGHGHANALVAYHQAKK